MPVTTRKNLQYIHSCGGDKREEASAPLFPGLKTVVANFLDMRAFQDSKYCSPAAVNVSGSFSFAFMV